MRGGGRLCFTKEQKQAATNAATSLNLLLFTATTHARSDQVSYITVQAKTNPSLPQSIPTFLKRLQVGQSQKLAV